MQHLCASILFDIKLSLNLIQCGQRIFNVHLNLSARCMHKKQIGTDKSYELIQKN